MRFLMINLILVCLLLFGIGYLAFGDTEIGSNPEREGGRLEDWKRHCGGYLPYFQASNFPTQLGIQNLNVNIENRLNQGI